jgi:hypothetical protein
LISAELRIIQEHWDELSSHLISDGDEHAALLFCGWSLTSQRKALLTRRVQVLRPDDFLFSGALHLSIAPTTLARAAKQAASEGAIRVLCHSHPWPGSTRPSPLDLDTENEFCGRVLPGRLRDAPAGGLVLGTEDVSARLWLAGEPHLMRNPNHRRRDQSVDRARGGHLVRSGGSAGPRMGWPRPEPARAGDGRRRWRRHARSHASGASGCQHDHPH